MLVLALFLRTSEGSLKMTTGQEPLVAEPWMADSLIGG